MSGPKGMNYQVVSAEELARRELQRAHDRLQARQDTVLALAIEAGPAAADAGHAPATKIRGADLATCAAREQEWTAYESRLRDAIEKARVAHGRAALATALAPVGPLPAFDLTVVVAAPETADNKHDKRLAAILTAASGLDDATLTTCHALAATAREAMAAGDLPRVGMMISQLETTVVQATARRTREATLATAREALASEYADVIGQATPQMRSRLAGAASRAELNACADDLAALRAQHNRELDRRFVLAAARAALQDMGYAVRVMEPGDGAAHLTATRSDWPSHALDVVFPDGRDTVHTVPIALGQTDQRDDVRFEQASCGDIETLCADLRKRGVVTDMFHHQPPGAVALRKAPAATTRKRRTPLEKDMGRG